MPRRLANRQSSAVTKDGADSNRPRVEHAIYGDVNHPRNPYRLRCLLSGTPAVRASLAPSQG